MISVCKLGLRALAAARRSLATPCPSCRVKRSSGRGKKWVARHSASHFALRGGCEAKSKQQNTITLLENTITLFSALVFSGKIEAAKYNSLLCASLLRPSSFPCDPHSAFAGFWEMDEPLKRTLTVFLDWGKREGSLQEIELAGVKYFHHGDLKEFTHDTKQKNLLGKTLFGRILRGRDSNGNEIIIKTWDVYAPISRVMVLHPYALCDEVAFLTKDERLGGFGRHQNLPNLVGYTFDSTFAVIYQMNIKNSLQSMLDSDELDWNTRLDIAIQVAKLIMDFHSRLVPVGGIDVSNMLIDEEWNVKLCEFGLRSHVGVAETRRITWVYTGGSYAAYIPEVNCSGGKFVLKSDIYAFGIFLMELICKVKPTAAEDLWEGGWDGFYRVGLFATWIHQGLILWIHLSQMISRMVLKSLTW
ncbi:hypothetical protein DM860_012725 [Cuscuta australis]|uniref:Protein kinase domain-containing protein n=1 Tax=Cuscuta australis TaxID=267555 RepID=A0A328DUG3_9ASTE|nr:hypothetical protein DM860_012725 [Cuscuta australis]